MRTLLAPSQVVPARRPINSASLTVLTSQKAGPGKYRLLRGAVYVFCRMLRWPIVPSAKVTLKTYRLNIVDSLRCGRVGLQQGDYKPESRETQQQDKAGHEGRGRVDFLEGVHGDSVYTNWSPDSVSTLTSSWHSSDFSHAATVQAYSNASAT